MLTAVSPQAEAAWTAQLLLHLKLASGSARQKAFHNLATEEEILSWTYITADTFLMVL